MHSLEQPGLPDFALHAHLGLPQVTSDHHFWPGLPFPPMFNPALGLPWTKSPVTVPSFHALLSQYVLTGGVPQGSSLGSGLEEQSRSSSPTETASPSQLSPTRTSLENLRLRNPDLMGPETSPHKQLQAKS